MASCVDGSTGGRGVVGRVPGSGGQDWGDYSPQPVTRISSGLAEGGHVVDETAFGAAKFGDHLGAHLHDAGFVRR